MTSKIPEPQSTQKITLGDKIAAYRHRFPFSLYALLLVAGFGAVCLFIMGQWDAYQKGILYGQFVAQKTLSGWLWGAGVFLFMAAIALIGIMRHPRSKVVLYEWGLAIEGKSITQVRWDEVVGVRTDYRIIWYLIFPVRRRQVTLDLYDKRRMVFDGRLAKLDDLRNKICNAVFPLVERKIRPGLGGNAVLNFGPVLVYPGSGIKMKGKAIPWERISSLDVDGGALELVCYSDSAAKQKLQVRLGEVPNVPVLLATVDELLARKRE